MTDGPVGRVRSAVAWLGFVRTSVLGHPMNKGHGVRVAVRVLRWQIRKRLRLGPTLTPFANETWLWAHPDSAVASLLVYNRLPDFEEMTFIMHYLRKGDIFVDIGANIGTYTALAAATTRGVRVLSFEPSAHAFVRLKQNVEANGFTNCELVQMAVGERLGTGFMTTQLDSTNHVLPTRGAVEGSARVQLTTLDAETRRRSISHVAICKIDVEGSEIRVLRGARRLLASGAVDIWVVELNGAGLAYGVADADTIEMLRAHDYVPRRYEPGTCTLRAVPFDEIPTTGNTIFIRRQHLTVALHRIRNNAMPLQGESGDPGTTRVRDSRLERFGVGDDRP